jgi:energy-coupling factor transporter ATP-binding protein EcfA2
MFENYQICPYTGLRSFTEDESLYFKGREEDIDQATSQLQKNKFLMLTGASGDGKSSLVYAGIIPNARAGFLKSKYTNWCVANFRPERTPFQNLCNALAKQLDISNPYTVQGELNHGFSALVDLYRNSKRFIDINSAAWQQAGDKEKGAMRREAANLIILVDQFEEFFTNPENYQHGAPSRDANLVLNLLLETARIALDEDIPIYVVFTMRSDYIGQCAAFRGLPEYIGFSQFFVPRLNRSQLQQVIEEPAKLSGNRIARRLTERLIHDLTEGVDQLPILQHALNQVWVAADHGNEEMDLVHYAMVGGMSVNELPDEQVQQFNSWFTSLPPEIKACYHAPNLQNVLDTHTNKLYEQAAGYYSSKTNKSISAADAKIIIRTAFTCLTKIDQSRAVRNRMTLQEITNILGNTNFDANAVGALLNIFREPGNTFIHPFITDDDPESQNLRPSQVLDITHESLIRNWQYLGQWAKEEFDSHSVSLDFEKQLDRWVNSDKSNNFLLSIGPLTYFENWYNKAKPNAWWIARYLPEETNNESKLGSANEILNNSREFLKKSSRKHVVTRTIMRYGPKRIAVALCILAFLTLTSFAIRGYFRKQNSFVLDSIHQQTLKLADNPKINLLSNAALIVEELKLGRTTVDEVVNSIHDTVQKINIVNGIASLLILQGRDEPKKEIFRSLLLTDSLLESFTFPQNNPVQLSAVLKEMNQFRVALELGYHYNPDPQISEWRKRNALRSARWSYKIAETQPANFDDIQDFTLALENAINYKIFTSDEIKKLLQVLSPFENGLQTEWLKSNFSKDKLLLRGSQGTNYGFKHNGLYQELAYLYAASGNSEKAVQCIDTLLAYSQNNFQGDYASGGDNAANIAVIYFLNEKTDQLDAFVNGYCLRKKITAEEFYVRLLGRNIRSFEAAGNLRLYNWMDENQNLNLQFCSKKQLTFFYNKYREVVQSTIKDADQKNFLMALSFKNEGILKSLNKEPSAKDDLDTKGFFDKAVSFYNSVNPKYLEVAITVMDASSVDEIVLPRKLLFIYPDLRTSFHPLEPRSFFYFYLSDVFLDYIITNHLLDSFYPGPDELNYLLLWIDAYNTKNINLDFFLCNKIRYQVLKNLEQELSKRNISKSIDLNWLYLYLGKAAQDSGNNEDMLRYYNKIERANIFNLLRSKEFAGYVRDQSFRMIAYAMEGYIKAGQFDNAQKLAAMFKNPVNRSSLYAYTASQLLREKVKSSLIPQLIDSAYSEMARVENITDEQPNRRILAYALAMQDPSKNVSRAYGLIRNLPAKFATIQEICRSFSFYNDLHNGETNIPDFISGSDQADFLWNILYGYSEGTGVSEFSWKEFTQDYPKLKNQFILYLDENS